MSKILIVDDSPTIVQLLKKGLESNNAIFSADNGVDALRLVREKTPDLVILDLMLPKLDGFHVCAMVKKDANLKKIKILMLTGRADADSKDLGLECGADEYITKDTDPQQIIDLANNLLSSGKDIHKSKK